jgi:plastocyanin
MLRRITVTIAVFLISIILPNMNNIAFANQVITILSGASDTGGQVLFDTMFYPLKRNTQLVWLNNDNVGHRIIITTTAAVNGTRIVDSGIIKPKNSFSYIFHNPGTYRFSSPDFPNKYGVIVVTNDISNVIASHLKNNVDIQVTRYPSKPKVGELTHFVITFIKANSHENQEHIDYKFTISDSNGRILYTTGVSRHSTSGVESVSYRFDHPGNYISAVTVYAILFQPVIEDQTNSSFEVTR